MDFKLKNMGENTGSMMNDRAREMVLTQLGECNKIYASEHAEAKKGQCAALRNVKYTQAFQSLNLPSSVILNLSNTDIVENIIISVKCNLQIAYAGGGSRTSPAGWLYELLDQIQYTINGSTTYTVSGSALRHFLMLALETGEKRKQFLELAGPVVTFNTTATPQEVTADLVLNVPALCKLPAYLGDSLPLDLRMANNISQVIVYWKSPAVAFPAKTVSGGSYQLQIANNAFTDAKFIVVNNTWVDNNLSLANILKMDPMASYVHPHTFIQSFVVPINGEATYLVSSSNPGATVTRTISGLTRPKTAKDRKKIYLVI